MKWNIISWNFKLKIQISIGTFNLRQSHLSNLSTKSQLYEICRSKRWNRKNMPENFTAERFCILKWLSPLYYDTWAFLGDFSCCIVLADWLVIKYVQSVKSCWKHFNEKMTIGNFHSLKNSQLKIAFDGYHSFRFEKRRSYF